MAAKKIDITRLLKRAEEALQRRNYGLAIFNYIQAVTIQPDNIDARTKLRATQTRAAGEKGASTLKAMIGLLKANLLATLKKHEKAIIACEHGLTAHPSHVGLMKRLAASAAAAEYFAVAAWQRQEIADKYGKEDEDNLWDLVDIYKDLDQPQQALECLERLKKINPEADIGPMEREISAQQTTQIYAKGVERGSREILENQEEAEQLELDANKLRTDDQRRKVINYRLANDAKERPDDHRLWINLGDVAFDMDDWVTGYEEAKKYYEKAREIVPSDNTVNDKLGDLEIKQMRVELQNLQKKLKANPGDAKLKALYKKKNKERIDFELVEYERRVKAQPLKTQFHNRLGELYFQTERYDDAIGELQQAAKDPKFKISALNILGRCFHAMGQHDMAITQFERARQGQELFPKIVDALYFEAQAREDKGDLASLKKALEHYTFIYENDINYKDVKKKVPELQKRVKDAEAGA